MPDATLRLMPRRRFAAAAPALLVVIAAALWLPHSPAGLRDLVLAAGAAAPLAALVAWALLTPALFPGTVLAGASGLAFGAAEGVAVALVGAVLGGFVAFALARTAGRQPALGLARRSRKVARLHGLLEQRGFSAILAARLMPGVPATALYYAAGASPVRRRDFAGAITIGALLRTTPYVLLGHGLASGSGTGILVAAASIAVGAIAAALLMRGLRRAAPAPAAG
jgi:uncharacterized membrane protein YdjX (TVP38/TMEM64 family)